MVMRLMHNTLTPKPVTHTNNQPETWSTLSAYYTPFPPLFPFPTQHHPCGVACWCRWKGALLPLCLEAAISLSNEHRFVNALQRLN